jgi:hypothetical protein
MSEKVGFLALAAMCYLPRAGHSSLGALLGLRTVGVDHESLAASTVSAGLSSLRSLLSPSNGGSTSGTGQ